LRRMIDCPPAPRVSQMMAHSLKEMLIGPKGFPGPGGNAITDS